MLQYFAIFGVVLLCFVYLGVFGVCVCVNEEHHGIIYSHQMVLTRDFEIIYLKEGNVLTTHSTHFFTVKMVKYHTYSQRKPAAATWATLSD